MAVVTVAGTVDAVHAQALTDQAAIGRALLDAYPGVLARIEDGMIVTTSGQRIALDDQRPVRSHQDMLDGASVKDMFAVPYPAGAPLVAPAHNRDPGRAKHRTLFDALYGDCARGEVAADLVDVVWLAKKGGGRIRVSKRHGAADKLAAVSRELDELPAQFDPFLRNPAGGYVCREIAGSARRSAHGWGIAVDLAPARAHYWRWQERRPAGGVLAEGSPGIAYANAIPPEIVAIFERHGFIWGGRWYHYDTMHFEYRPELFHPALATNP